MSVPPTGALSVTDLGSGTNALVFAVKMLTGKMSSAFLAKVVAVTTDSQVAAAGTVDVLPLVVQVAAAGGGTAVPGSVVYGLPFVRWQAGLTAVIIDPVVGDIGLVIVCDRDISSAKKTMAVSNPGSARRNNKADGIYVGGVLNGLAPPTEYIRRTANPDGTPNGWQIVTPGPITWTASNTTLDAAGNVTFNGDVTAGAGGGDSVTLQGHRHNIENVQAGGATLPTDPPSPGT